MTVVVPVLKDVGCYVNADNNHAFLFGAEENLTCISGYEAYTQALVTPTQHVVISKVYTGSCTGCSKLPTSAHRVEE